MNQNIDITSCVWNCIITHYMLDILCLISNSCQFTDKQINTNNRATGISLSVCVHFLQSAFSDTVCVISSLSVLLNNWGFCCRSYCLGLHLFSDFRAGFRCFPDYSYNRRILHWLIKWYQTPRYLKPRVECIACHLAEYQSPECWAEESLLLW